MKELVEIIAKSLVDSPEDVVVTETTDDEMITTVTGTITNVGTTDNILESVTIINASNEDITSSYNITKQEVIDYSPSLADKVARNTSVNTIEEIADEIAETIKGEENENA